MALRLVQIAMDARDDCAVDRFWAAALGWAAGSEEPGVTSVEPAGLAYPGPAAVCIDVLAVPEPKTVKNRVHLDLATTSAAHQADLVARLHHDLGSATGLEACRSHDGRQRPDLNRGRCSCTCLCADQHAHPLSAARAGGRHTRGKIVLQIGQ